MIKFNQNEKVFLKSNWLKLASANYIIDPSILEKHLPKGTLLEAFNGNYFVSLVAFRYSETRLLNLKIPYHDIFEEINLRFYVKREITPGNWRSEVAFTKLFFPKRALTLVAKYIYKENYETLPMRHDWTETKNELLTSYGLKKKQWHNFEIVSDKKSKAVTSNSPDYFFSKHYWGTSQIDDHSCTIYKIEHPEWESFKVHDATISFDFNSIFGPEFNHLTNKTPDSVHLFNGSEVIVNKKEVI